MKTKPIKILAAAIITVMIALGSTAVYAQKLAFAGILMPRRTSGRRRG